MLFVFVKRRKSEARSSEDNTWHCDLFSCFLLAVTCNASWLALGEPVRAFMFVAVWTFVDEFGHFYWGNIA